MSRKYFRHFPVRKGKLFAWRYLVEPFVAWRPNEFETRTMFGATMAGRTDDLLQQYVYFFGVWEPHLTHWMMGRLRDGDVFVDVGANVGYFTLLASRLVGPSGRVVAIEASSSIMKDLHQNLALNPTDNVRAVCAAVSESAGVAPFYVGPSSHIGLSGMLDGPELELEGMVPTESLCHLLTDDEIRRARLIKIDIEGAELLAIRGMQSMLTNGRSDLEVMVEVDPGRLERQGLEVAEIFETFQTNGFFPYAIENDYTASGYMTRRRSRPERLTNLALRWETDLVFSRADVERL